MSSTKPRWHEKICCLLEPKVVLQSMSILGQWGMTRKRRNGNVSREMFKAQITSWRNFNFIFMALKTTKNVLRETWLYFSFTKITLNTEWILEWREKCMLSGIQFWIRWEIIKWKIRGWSRGRNSRYVHKKMLRGKKKIKYRLTEYNYANSKLLKIYIYIVLN